MIWKLFPGGVMFFIGTTCKFAVFCTYIGIALFWSMTEPGDQSQAASFGALLIAYIVWYRRDLALARLKAKTNRTTRVSA
jgi:hypothetical protein